RKITLARAHCMPRDFSTVTEHPGARATSEQRSMLFTRYHLAKLHSIDKDVLEIACGAGMGLGYLARSARSVTGGDIDETNLNVARTSYADRPQIQLHKQNAEQLEVPDRNFDTLLLFEAIYYLANPSAFLREAQRVLRPRGVLVICSVNRQWGGFNRSPHSVQYFDADEFRCLLEQHGMTAQIYAGFPERPNSMVKWLISLIRSFAIRWRLIPRTMSGKQWLKRLFYGPLTTLDSEVREHMAPLEPLVELQSGAETSQYKVLYAVGRSKNITAGKIAA
ncbi:MAG TPA: class I SAM-dependent methyltransferase, partial [Pirellulales bacterium]